MISIINDDALWFSDYSFIFDLSIFCRRPRQSSQLGVDFQTILVAESKAATDRLSSRLDSFCLASIKHMYRQNTIFKWSTYRRRVLEERFRHDILPNHTILPFKPRLDAKKLHEQIHFSTPWAGAGTWAVEAGLAVSFLLHELCGEPVEMGLCVGFPELCCCFC